MGALINFLVLMVLLFTGLAQTRTIPPGVAWPTAAALAALTLVLAIIRYKQRKDRGG